MLPVRQAEVKLVGPIDCAKLAKDLVANTTVTTLDLEASGEERETCVGMCRE